MSLNRLVVLGVGLFALLSAIDWLMTYSLLRMHPGAFEANPLAAACLARHGWNGLALYKVGTVSMFIGAIVPLTRRRPAVAATIVTCGCALLLGVTIYTHGLIRAAQCEGSDPNTTAELRCP